MKQFFRLIGFIAAIALFLLPSTPVYAQITTDDVKAIKEDEAWWDPFWNSCTPDNYDASTSPTQLVGKDNIERSYNYFVGKKLESWQSAGIVGNLRQESGTSVNPKANQPNGPGRGIAQWSEGGRWDHLVRWAGEQTPKRDPEALDTQLDFIWYEMTEISPWKQALPAIKATTTVERATFEFMDKFEKAGDPHMSKRETYAKEVLDWYGGGSGAPAPGQVNAENTDPGSPCGGTGILVDGYSFPIAPRTKRNYVNIPCNNRPLVRYTDKYGQSATMPNCHHDGTPAFDLTYAGAGGVPVYAITKGKITRVDTQYTNQSGGAGKACASIMFKADNATDKSYYWYGHILNPNVQPGQTVEAGAPIAVVAPKEYGPKCYGGGVHLHIDRGCKDPKGEPQTGGGDRCRDPNFLGDMKKIWEGLPEE